MKLLDRFVLSHLLKLLLLGLATFSSLVLSVLFLEVVLRLASRYRLSGGILFKLFVYQLPQTVNYAIPMATLFASLLLLATLSSSGELTALLTSGVSFKRTISSAIVLGAVLTLLSFYLTEFVVPHSNRAFHSLKESIVRGKKVLSGRNVVVKEVEGGRIKRLICADSVIGNLLEGVRWVEFNPDGSFRRAGEARAVVKTPTGWIAEDGVLYEFDRKGGTTRVPFQSVEVEFAFQQVPRSTNPEDLSFRELLRNMEFLEKSGIAKGKLLFHLYFKTAFPFATLIFVLLGLPLGASGRRTGSGLGMGITLVLTLFYYLLIMVLANLATIGNFPPFLAAWLPNIVFGSTGVTLIALRDHPYIFKYA